MNKKICVLCVNLLLIFFHFPQNFLGCLIEISGHIENPRNTQKQTFSFYWTVLSSGDKMERCLTSGKAQHAWSLSSTHIAQHLYGKEVPSSLKHH